MSTRRRNLFRDNTSTISFDDEESSSVYYKNKRVNLDSDKHHRKHKYKDDCDSDEESSSTIIKRTVCEPKKPKKKKEIIAEETICATEAKIRSMRDKVVESLKVDTYCLDTDIISYKPRLINVPSEEYPTIDSAMCSLKPRKGGYVIKLSSSKYDKNGNDTGFDYTSYTLTKNTCAEVDNLTIIGDDNPFAGVSYVQRCHTQIVSNGETVTLPPIASPIYTPCNNCNNYTDESNCDNCSDDPNPNCNKDKRKPCNTCHINKRASYGSGPFDVYRNDTKITVKSARGYDPDFSCIPRGTQILFLTDVINQYHVGIIKRADGNSIWIEQPLSTSISLKNNPNGLTTFIEGAGFAFIPSVRLRIIERNFNIGASNSLKLRGLTIDATNPLLFLSSPNGCIDVGNCYISGNICYRGRYLLTHPNIYTGLTLLWPGSAGEAYCQTFYGVSAHLEALSCNGLWDRCIFIFNSHAIELLHGTTVDFSNSFIINCCVGLTVSVGSHGVVTGVTFCHNTYAIICTYLSTVGSSIPQIPGLERTLVTPGPWFVDNSVMISAYYNCYVFLPLTSGAKNLIPFVIDGKVYTTIESNPIGNINQHNSVIIITRNPFAPNTTTLGCDIGSTANLNRIDTWGVASMSFVTELNRIDPLSITTADSTINSIPETMDDERTNDVWSPIIPT